MTSSQLGVNILARMEAKLENTTEDASAKAEQHTRSPSKARSLSDGGPPALSPALKNRESEEHKKTQDDTAIDNPSTPQRSAILPRGLGLQMPPRNLMSSGSTPLSPKLDYSQTYGSPSSILPRRSRGLDFSRAATNLHHSTLAERSSPDTSPTITGRAMNIPNRRSGSHFWGGFDPINHNSNSRVSSSLGSVNMLGSDSSESSSSDDDLMDADDIDDSILVTPQVNRLATPFEGGPQASPGSSWIGQSAAVISLMNIQRTRLRHGKNRRSSGSGSGHSIVSPGSRSPPPTMRSIESAGNAFLGRDVLPGRAHSRRESITWGANQLHISGSESDDGALKSTLENVDSMLSTPGRDVQRGVIRRAVTRRGNMLPKSKHFARIQAALAEEDTPLETEFRREAEVVRLTRASDMDIEPTRCPPMSGTTTTHSSPCIEPVTHDSLEGVPEDDIMGDLSSGLSRSFKQHAMRNSKGKDFWDTFSDDRNRTPPPGFFHRGSTSGVSDGISPALSTPPSSLIIPPTGSLFNHTGSSPPRVSTQPGAVPIAADISRKLHNKRRRDDDLDPTSFKRRAVSPAMSVHNSPVMQSPLQRDHWGARPSGNGEANKGGSNGGPMKRVGFQGMVDTNDGLMKMSIE